MTNIAFSHDAVLKCIADDVSACKHLLSLLSAEREALKSRDIEALEKIIQDKSDNLQQLEISAKQRGDWIVPHMKPDDSPESIWLDLLETMPPQIQQLWQELKALLQECQEENEINGKLLARNQQVFSRLLSLVRGQQETSSLYTPKGSHGTGSNAGSLGEA